MTITLAPSFEPQIAGPANSPAIARICAIANDARGDPGNGVRPSPHIDGIDDDHLVGTGTPGAALRVMSNGRQVATGTIDESGDFSIEVELAVGDRVFVADSNTSNMLLVP